MLKKSVDPLLLVLKNVHDDYVVDVHGRAGLDKDLCTTADCGGSSFIAKAKRVRNSETQNFGDTESGGESQKLMKSRIVALHSEYGTHSRGCSWSRTSRILICQDGANLVRQSLQSM
jgi:hypothetical protein